MDQQYAYRPKKHIRNRIEFLLAVKRIGPKVRQYRPFQTQYRYRYAIESSTNTTTSSQPKTGAAGRWVALSKQTPKKQAVEACGLDRPEVENPTHHCTEPFGSQGKG
jgi:hypothetical protein